MEKYLVLIPYRDKDTNERIKRGKIIDLTEERANELNEEKTRVRKYTSKIGKIAAYGKIIDITEVNSKEDENTPETTSDEIQEKVVDSTEEDVTPSEEPVEDENTPGTTSDETQEEVENSTEKNVTPSDETVVDKPTSSKGKKK